MRAAAVRRARRALPRRRSRLRRVGKGALLRAVPTLSALSIVPTAWARRCDLGVARTAIVDRAHSPVEDGALTPLMAHPSGCSARSNEQARGLSAPANQG